MFTVEEVLSHVEQVKYGFASSGTKLSFISILCNIKTELQLWDIDEYCPDIIFPLILKQSDYITGVLICECPKRIIVVQFIRNLLAEKPDIEITLLNESLPWVINYGLQFRNVVSHPGIDDPYEFGKLLSVEGNTIEKIGLGGLFLSIPNDFVSCFEHPNCRVRELELTTPLVDFRRLRNTLIRRIVSYQDEIDVILLPYMVDDNEFEIMLHVLCGLRGCLPDELWRVIFYFL